MNAKNLLNAMIAEYAHRTTTNPTLCGSQWSDGFSAALVHATKVAYDYDDTQAVEFVAERFEETYFNLV